MLRSSGLFLIALCLSLPATSFAASADDDVEWDGIHSDTSGVYVSPQVFAPGDSLTIRLRAKRDDLTGATCLFAFGGAAGNPQVPMTKASSDTLFDWWTCTLSVPIGASEVYYRFAVTDGTDTDYYDAGQPSDGWNVRGMSDDERSFQDFRLYANFSTPDWSQGATFYQIFPDRFRDGRPENNRLYPEDCFWYLDFSPASPEAAECAGYDIPETPKEYEKNCLIQEDWTALPNGGPCDYFGGDLVGIDQRVAYLEDLGVNAVYLNPIFRSPSNHKYDTMDYELVDPRFGTREELESLTNDLHARGMKIVVDGVFNHVSDLGSFYNYWSNYSLATSDAAGEDAFPGQCGAWEQEFLSDIGDADQCTSSYSEWFRLWVGVDNWDVDRDGNTSEPAAHTCGWAGLEFMPEIDFKNPSTDPDSAPRTWLYGGTSAEQASVARDTMAGGWLSDGKYISQGLDGWRLDVPDNAGYFTQPTGCDKAATDPTIWQGFRQAVKAVGDDKYISGEIWVDAADAGGLAGDWFQRRTYDGVMNYRFFATPVSCFLTGKGVHDDPSECQQDGFGVMTLGAANAVDALDAHLAEQRRKYPAGALFSSQNMLSSHDTARFISRAGGDLDVLYLAQVMQATLPGAPMLYYGDELGLEGANNELGRSPMPWSVLEDPSSTRARHRERVRALHCIRNAHSALRTGSFTTLHTHNGNRTYAFARFDGGDVVVVALNASSEAQTITFDLSRVGLDTNDLADLHTGDAYTASAGSLTVTLPARGSLLLVPAAAVSATSDCRDPNEAPTASTDDITIDEGQDATLDASNSSDPEGAALELTWRDASGAVVGTTAQVTLPDLARGEYRYSVTVFDGVYTDSAESVVTVIGTGNPPPPDGGTDPDAGTNPDAGTASPDGGAPPIGPIDSGIGNGDGGFDDCSCSATDSAPTGLPWAGLVMLVGLLGWLRRR